MLKDIVEVRPLELYRLYLRFEDGTEGEADVSQLVLFEGVFADLREPERFQEVVVDEELGCVRWPGGADLDPDVLYSMVAGTPLPGKKETLAQ